MYNKKCYENGYLEKIHKLQNEEQEIKALDNKTIQLALKELERENLKDQMIMVI